MNVNQYYKKSSVSFKHLLSLDRISEEDIAEIILSAREFKSMRLVHETSTLFKGKYVLLVTKPNLPRAGITFQIAIKELSGEPIVTSLSGEQLENLLADSNYVKALSACGLSAIMVCTSKDSDSNAFVGASSVPVINATAVKSPIEALSALMTIADYTPNFKGINVTIVGDLSSGDYSFVTGLVKFGANVTLLSKSHERPQKEVLDYLSQFCDVKITDNKETALKNADYVYFTESENGVFVTEADISSLEKPVKIMSSVPVCKKLAEESVFNFENSLVAKQTENLLHVGKAVLHLLSNKK
ncbi:MAG: hypothetical protein J6Q38_00180 [Clostridia bacterium]|nr:hypothetical protein [Clostridia bacterium]